MFIRHDAEFWAEYSWEDPNGYLNYLTFLFKKLGVYPDSNGCYWSPRIEDDDLVIVTPEGEKTGLFQIAGVLEWIATHDKYFMRDKINSSTLLDLLKEDLFEREQIIDDC